MEFNPEKVNDFLALFEIVKGKIINCEGCLHLELCKDVSFDHVYYTFSKWESEKHLNNYRHSDFFEDTWTKTKALFGGKPLAYSLVSQD